MGRFSDYIERKSKVFRDREEWMGKVGDQKWEKYFVEADPKISGQSDREDFYFKRHYVQMDEALGMLKGGGLMGGAGGVGKKFMVLCFAPGGSTSRILEEYPKAKGTGISLHPKYGGLEVKIEGNKKFGWRWGDITAIRAPQAEYDLVMTHCLDMTYSRSGLNYTLDYSSFAYALRAVRGDGKGTVVLKYTMRNLVVLGNLIWALKKICRRVDLMKSESTYGVRSTLYIVVRGVKRGVEWEKLVDRLENQGEILRVRWEEFDSGFYEDYRKILEPVMKVHIKGIKKFLKDPYYMKA